MKYSLGEKVLNSNGHWYLIIGINEKLNRTLLLDLTRKTDVEYVGAWCMEKYQDNETGNEHISWAQGHYYSHLSNAAMYLEGKE